MSILAFLIVGVIFGLASYRWRRHFSEGTARPDGPGVGQGLDGRWAWLTVCTLLWPLLIVTGALGQISRRALARQRAAAPRSRRGT
jgi:hypothetical protein